jgi:hypothetical protein
MIKENDAHLQAFAALQDMRLAAERGRDEPTVRSIPASRIVAYARRRDSTADLNLERSLRREPGLSILYRKALSMVAQAVSMRAIAASGSRVTHRLVGDHSLEIVSEADDMHWLVLRLAHTRAPVTMIELRGSNGEGRRVALGEPIEGVIQLPLDPAFTELTGIAELIADPATGIYLL